MPDTSTQWQLQPKTPLPDWFLQAVKQQVPALDGRAIAQLLWQRGIQDPALLPGFLNAHQYQPASPFEFGEEMIKAVQRIQEAIATQEVVAIWGDFDADGVTATAVLWDGLGQFFTQQKTLHYYIPNRLTESHGLSQQGIDQLHRLGCQLIVTCDTGSTNLAEIQYAIHLGIDVIVTDHHTLPEARPPVTAIVNPRSLPSGHPLATLSGVAVAYKLVEALYETLPELPQKPLEELLDLVAIGLIADLVELKGDCRYLAQRGIEQLQKQANPATATRPGVAKLLEFCKRSGDRPTDISFGIGPRINAVSRIQGDAHFCVELLTSQDKHLCTHLAEATELANARRKALQKDVMAQVNQRLAQCDLSTTRVIVLADDQWQPGVLGLVAGQIAQEYGRPTILLQTEGVQTGQDSQIARGSARSVNNIDLYQLVKGQAHLLHRFGGHPFAAGLSLSVENLPLFTEAINQQLRQSQEGDSQPSIQADLVVNVAELGKELFQELKLLEPCGMGNPVPRLMVENCWFSNVRNRKIQDRRGQKLEYIKTQFELWDDSCQKGFSGVWWGHYRDEIPEGRCDAIVELDYNTYDRRYEVRMIAVRPCESIVSPSYANEPWIIDWRNEATPKTNLTPAPLIIQRCPTRWQELQKWFRRARQEQRPLAIAFAPPTTTPAMETWQQLVGIAKYLSRTGKTATRQQFLDKLSISDLPLQLGFKSLTYLGFELSSSENGIQIRQRTSFDRSTQDSTLSQANEEGLMQAVKQFLIAVKEEQFRQQYFFQVPLSTIQAIAEHSSLKLWE